MGSWLDAYRVSLIPRPRPGNEASIGPDETNFLLQLEYGQHAALAAHKLLRSTTEKGKWP